MFPTEIAQTAIQLNFAWEGWERVRSIFPFEVECRLECRTAE